MSQSTADGSPASTGTRVPKPSPFSKGSKRLFGGVDGSQGKRKKTQPITKVIKVVTPYDGLNGFMIYVDTFADEVMTSPFYNCKEKNNQSYLEGIGCVLRCMNIKKRDAEDDDDCRQNSNGYNYKSFVVMVGEAPNDDDIEAWHDDTFIPNLQLLGKLDDIGLPKICPPTEFETLDCWSKVLKKGDWQWMVNDFCRNREERISTVAFFRQDPLHIAAIYEPGTTPYWFMENYSLGLAQLDPKDHGTYEEGNNQDN